MPKTDRDQTGAVDVAIVGGGAAGLMCAIEAARRGRRVQVLEHTRHIGRKILMSGGGRCNFTNLYVSPDNYLSQNPPFCRSALARFTPWDFIARVDAHGIGWHEKELGQLFCNDTSRRILAMLEADAREAGVRIRVSTAVREVSRQGPGFVLRTDDGALRCESLVVATGGLSIPRMGATGWAYDLARTFGHRIVPTRAALVPLTFSGRPMDAIEGLSGIAAPAGAEAGGVRFDADLLFTHRGLSGPVILQVSSYWREGEPIRVDLLPGRDAGQALIAQKHETPVATPEAALSRWLPKRLAERLCRLHGWAGRLQSHTDAELRAMGQVLNGWILQPSGTEGYRTAEVTLGGIDTQEISSKTMASARVPGLYFVGEALDVTGHLGGYNFQWAWASGHAAGQVC